MKNLIYTLKERGFIDAMTSEILCKGADQPLKAYVGFDPTADSLHLGNLVGIMGLAWFQRYGHEPFALVGGATGMIGDPSGRSSERNLLDPESLEKNLVGIRHSLEAVLKGGVKIVNNYTWFQNIGYINFLRDVGKHFRIGSMLAKESVKTRLSSEEGMSYTEFSYQLLQAYDFLHLFQEYGITVQMGGSDQWGNITAGTELVRKVTGEVVHGLTFPLITRSDGKKFGKSEGGAIWLNADRLSAYDFYQYLFRLPDADVPKLLRMLTFLELDEIREIEMEMQRKDYTPNTAQARLAEEVTRLVHGEKGVEEAKRVTEAARPGSHTELNSVTLQALAADLPSKKLLRSEVVGIKLIDLLVLLELVESKGEGRRMIIGGGVYLNNGKVADDQTVIGEKHLIENRFLLVGMGKKKKLVVHVYG